MMLYQIISTWKGMHASKTSERVDNYERFKQEHLAHTALIFNCILNLVAVMIISTLLLNTQISFQQTPDIPFAAALTTYMGAPFAIAMLFNLQLACIYTMLSILLFMKQVNSESTVHHLKYGRGVVNINKDHSILVNNKKWDVFVRKQYFYFFFIQFVLFNLAFQDQLAKNVGDAITQVALLLFLIYSYFYYLSINRNPSVSELIFVSSPSVVALSISVLMPKISFIFLLITTFTFFLYLRKEIKTFSVTKKIDFEVNHPHDFQMHRRVIN